MNRTSRTATLFTVALPTILAITFAAAVPATATAATAVPPNAARPAVRNVCGTAPVGFARCLAEVRTDVHGGRGVRGPAAAAVGRTGVDTALPTGYGPADLRAAYQLPDDGGANQTVAIVDAGDDANAEADLAVYRQTYNLAACTTADGCFRKVNQTGQANPLPPDDGWGIEIALDVDMVSAACPHCKILLVEADDDSSASLGAAENAAAALGANEISNSYGEPEEGAVLPYLADYSHPGVAITASSGDTGYGIPMYPAAAPTVIAVGGTSLAKAANARGWSETAWIGAGSGCSAWIDKPSWQEDPNCPGRMVADVAADADPDTGPAVYDTSDDDIGWQQTGGTSASSPFIAGVIGLAGNPGDFSNASYIYARQADLNDVVGGNNVTGENCGGDYQCTAVTGYDGPTGLGTPNGLGAF